MATIQASGVKAVCQHRNATCRMVALDTATDDTGAWELTDFHCPDCGRSFPHHIGPNGRPYKHSRIVAAENLPSVESIAKPTQPQTPTKKQPPTPAELADKATADIVTKIGGDGPGTRLALGFFRKGYHRSCQACIDLAKQMNEWGSAGCRERIDAIVEDVLPRAKQWVADTHRFTKGVLGLVGAVVDVETPLLKTGIRAAVVDAIDEWDASQQGNDQ